MAFLDLVREVVAETRNLPLGDVRADSTLDDLGVDSMAVAQMIVELELRLDRELPVSLLRRLPELETLGDVARELEASLDGPVAPATGPA